MKISQFGSRGLSIIHPPMVGDKKGEGSIVPYRGIMDYAGREVHAAAFGEMVTGDRRAVISNAFNFFISPDKHTDLSTGDAALSVDKSRLKVATTGPGVGEALIDSRPRNFYRPGYDAYALYTAAFDNVVTGVEQEHGVFDENDGYFVSLDDDGQISCNHRRAGVSISTTPQNAFYLDTLDGNGPSGFILNPQAMNIYYLQYGYLGVLPCVFSIYGGTRLGWIPFHYIDVVGSNNLLAVENPHLPLRFRVSGTGNVAAMYSGSWNAGIIGPERDHGINDQFTTDTINTITISTFPAPVLSVRNDATFQGKTNTVPFDLHAMGVSVAGNKDHFVKIIKGGVLTNPVWNQVDVNSALSVDVAATAITGGRLLRSYPLGSSDSAPDIPYEPGEIRGYPGEITSVVIYSTSNSSDVRASLHWDELK